MASGKTHLLIEGAVGAGLAAVWSFHDPLRFAVEGAVPRMSVAGFAAGYAFAALWLSPDLDLPKCDARRRWGPLRFLWHFYPKMFAHRGLSHDLLAGAASRLAYLGLALALLAGPPLALASSGGWIDPGLLRPERWSGWTPAAWGFVAGCYATNALHILVDAATPPAPDTRPREGARG